MKKMLSKTAGYALVSVALLGSTLQAAPLFAPLIVNDSAAGVETFLSLQASSWVGGPSSLHYYWFKKGTQVADLSNLNKGCDVENTYGHATPNDMVYQSTRAYKLTTYARKRLPSSSFGSTGVADGSTPSGYPGDFVGMAAIDLRGDAAWGSSGSAYVVDSSNGWMLSYRLLNQPELTFNIRNQGRVSYAWYPTGKVITAWLTAVVPDLSNLDAIEASGGYLQKAVVTTDGSLAYDRDEKPLSGTAKLDVTCMGLYNRKDILTNAQELVTRVGGSVGMRVDPAYATGYNWGAITYRLEGFTPTHDPQTGLSSLDHLPGKVPVSFLPEAGRP